MGDNPIHIDIAGDGTINAVLDANGSDGNTGYLTSMVAGNLGGGEGGSSWFGAGRLDDSPKLGTGPTHLVGSSPFNSGGSRKKKGTLTGLVAGTAAGGGSYGGSGARPEPSGGSDNYGSHAISGGTYGNINVDALLAGSGGGGGWMAKGGTGGGAIKITAGGTLTIGADIFTDGGQGGSHAGSIADGMGGSLQFWYDASDPQTVIKDANGKVNYWNDKVSNRHLAQATTASQPTHGTRLYNGKTVMDFDGGDWMESINNVPMSQSHFQLWIVAFVDSVNNEYESIFSYRSTNNDYQFDAGHSSNFYAQMRVILDMVPPRNFLMERISKGKPLVILIRNGKQVYINGVNKGSISGGTAVNNNKFLVGANRSLSEPFDGWIGEVFCLNHYPYDRYQDKGTRYLMGKWGVDAHLENSNTYNDAHVLGGSGSGGSIYLKAANLVINSGVTISANGGAAAPDIDRGGNTDATDGGGEGPAAGGGGRVYLEGTTSFVNNASVDNSNLTATGGQSQVRQYGGNVRSGDDGTVRVVRPQVSSLEFTSGTLTVNADAGEITHSGGSFMLGEITNKTFTAPDGTSYPYKLSTFTADKITLGSGVVVNITGSNPVSLRTRNHGDLTINTTINISGGAATEGPNAGGIAKAGGFNGGLSKANGEGPGKGKGYTGTTNGGGGAYGGRGSESDAGYSLTYGSADLSTHLLGGAGAGGGDWYPGGAGGGAIELFAHGDGVLTIGGSIKANGGDASRDHDRAGGGGAGGAIRLEGGSVVASGTLEAKGGNGLTHTPGGGGRIAIKTNGNLTLGTVALDGYRPGTLHISGATATNSINLSSGTITFDTTHGYWHHTSGIHGMGAFQEKEDDGLEYITCTFTFDSINLATGLNVILKGQNPLILKTRNHGNISLGTTLSADGGDSDSNYASFFEAVPFGIGKLGGANGGLKNSTAGLGAGGGKLSVDGTVGGGGGYGSAGQYYSTDTPSHTVPLMVELPYPTCMVDPVGVRPPVHGGGAPVVVRSPLEADGNGTLVTILSGAVISANGGSVGNTATSGGGGGSGGSIRLAGKTITNNGTIRAKGATPAGGTGGGGRIAFNYSTNLTQGTYDVGSGGQQGTVTFNTPPVVSSGNTATANFSNDNYRKRSAVRYDDLVFWYPFDEADGATTTDYSLNGRDATLKNMTGSNRVSGKIGGALSFDNPSTITSGDATGQHLDLGAWSFGGAHTFTAWIKADEFREQAAFLSLSGADSILFQFRGADWGGSLGEITSKYNGTAGGNEASESGISLIQWGQWVHLSYHHGRCWNQSINCKVLQNGSLFTTSASNKTAPDAVSEAFNILVVPGTQHLPISQETWTKYASIASPFPRVR